MSVSFITDTGIPYLRNDILPDITLIRLNAHTETSRSANVIHSHRQFAIRSQEEEVLEQVKIWLMPRLRTLDGESSLVPQIDCRISCPSGRREEILARLLNFDLTADNIMLTEPVNAVGIESHLLKLETFTESLGLAYKTEGYEVDDNGTVSNSERFEGEWLSYYRFEQDPTDMFYLDNKSTVGGFINPQGQLKYSFGLSLLYRSGDSTPYALPFLFGPSSSCDKIVSILSGSPSDAADLVEQIGRAVNHHRSLTQEVAQYSYCGQDVVVNQIDVSSDRSAQTPLSVPIGHGAKAFEVVLAQHIESVRSKIHLAIAMADEGSEMKAFRDWTVRAIQLDTLNFHDLHLKERAEQLDGGNVPYSVSW